MSAAPGWQHRKAQANGITLHYVEQGEGFPVVFCHGFPELWYSWRHQIPTLAAAGLRAIAPDLRGYGESDKPRAIEDYDIHHLVGDMVGLLDALEIEKAVFVGHDWGGIVVWSTAAMHPERVERVVSLNVPYQGRCTCIPPTEVLKKAGNQVGYMLFFQEPGRADRRFAENMPVLLRRFYDGATHRPEFLAAEDFDVYLKAFEAGGMTGPLNLYRNIDANWATTEHLAGSVIKLPCLLVLADRDPVIRPGLTEGMERYVPNLRRELISDCGHWMQQEKPDELSRLLCDYLADLAR